MKSQDNFKYEGMQTVDERLENIKHWLTSSLGLNAQGIAPASSDASFRRYFRIFDGGISYIVMDAPPNLEDCRQFIKVARAFHDMDMNVPLIHEQDLKQGFLLLSDLGDQQYLSVLDESNVEQLYGDALEALYRLQVGSQGQERFLPPYDKALMYREVRLFDEWFLTKYLDVRLSDEQSEMLEGAYQFLITEALQQPKSWVHRDYHSRNLMLCEQDNPGVLDFQDAVYGPVTYDLVSLLKDCYIHWPRERVVAWVRSYYERIEGELDLEGYDEKAFLRAFDIMGAQRHLKAIGIFARLKMRDDKPGYLKDIPRTLNYVCEVAGAFSELTEFHVFLVESVLPKMARVASARI